MKSSILYDRILRAPIIPLNNSDTSFSVDINSPSKSLKSVLFIFTKERSATKFSRNTEEFFNPKITKVEVTVEGMPNELYAQNMEYRHQYDEIVKHFAEGRLKEAGAIRKDLQLHNVNIASYYTDKYALWLDFRTIDDNRLHGIFIVCDVEGKLNEWIKLFKNTLKGHQTLFIIDDCSAEGEINKKQDALSELAFSGRHRNHSLWVLTQKYNSVSKDVREQIKWLCLFFTKYRDSLEDCLRENNVIPDKNERDRLKKCLQDRPYSKLILKCYQPTGYHLL